jgi:hypothetical protein
MTRIEILQGQLTKLQFEKQTAVGGRLREINNRIKTIENVLIREANYPESDGSFVESIRGKDGNNLDGKLSFVECDTFEDLPELPVLLPTVAIVMNDSTNDDAETIYLCFGTKRKLLVTVVG